MTNIDYAIREISLELERTSAEDNPEYYSALEESLEALKLRVPLGTVGKFNDVCPRCGQKLSSRKVRGMHIIKFCNECGGALLWKR